MLGEIFQSRYQVEESLLEGPVFRSYRVTDLLGKRPGLLFLYPYENRSPLDISSFLYRHERFHEALGARVPACQVGEADASLYVLCELEGAASPLSLPLGKKPLALLLSRILRDIESCRRAGLRIFELSPEMIWTGEAGEPSYLPPVFLHFPGLLPTGETPAASAPELGWGMDDFGSVDLHAFGVLVEQLSRGRVEWQGFRRNVLPRLLANDPAARPQPRELAGEKPLSVLPELEELRDAPEDGEAVPGLDEDVLTTLQTALATFGAGENVLIRVSGTSTPGVLASWRPQLVRWLALHGGEALRAKPYSWAQSGGDSAPPAALFFCDSCESPAVLLSPLWSRLAGEGSAGRFFILYDEDVFAASPVLEARVLELFGEIPRLRQEKLSLPPPSDVDPGERHERCAQVDRSLLEILALQDEPAVLGLLGRFFPVHEQEFFARIDGLYQAGELAWGSGLDETMGVWGQRAELADPVWRRWIREGMDPDRRRELHRLCVNLREGGLRRGPVHALQRLRHLLGAEDWPLAAREGLELFRLSRNKGWVLLREELAGVLRSPPVENLLPVAGKQDLYLHLGGRLQRQGKLEEADAIYRQGLHSLTGNPRFLDELLAETSQPPQIREQDRGAALVAASALVRGLAEISETRGEFARGIQCLTRMLDGFSEDFSAHGRGILYNDLAWLYYRKGQHEQAVERSEVALRLFDPAEHLLELGQTYNTLGAAQWALNHWAEAETYYKRSLALREKAGDENRIAASLNNLGNLYRHTERFPLAIDYFNRSMAIKKRNKNYVGYLISLYNVALISFEMNDLKTARNQCDECLELNRVVGNVQLGAEVKGLLGEIAQVEGQLEEAAAHLEEAIAVCREIEAHTELATMLRRMVPVQLAVGELDTTHATIEDGLEESWRVGSRFEEAQIRVFEAEYHLAREDTAAALKSLESAADIFSALDRYEWLARVYSRMGLMLLDDGQELKAREYLQQATDIIERRKVSALLAEWETLQTRLQQRLGHYVQRIESEGKTRLAGLYQALNLMSGRGDVTEVLGQVLALLAGSFGYRRAALCLFDGLSGASAEGPLLLGAGDFPDESTWLERSVELGEQPSISVEDHEEGGDGLTRIFIPLQTDGQIPGLLGLERAAAPCDEEERDFLSSFARLLALGLTGGGPGARPPQVDSAAPQDGSSGIQQARLIGKGRDMRRVRRLIVQVQDVEATVLITGESGTGKEEVARAIHYGSARGAQPFLAVNCASIPTQLLESTLFGHERGAFTGASHRHIGVFEEAEGGTVFLDEIGEMGPDMQAKLLRVLQNKQFTRVGGNLSLRCDVRILTATNRKLEEEVKASRFREDLFYRINVLRIHLLPLRQKREDLPLLIEYFLAQSARELGIEAKRLSSDVMELFLRHPWPGNVRQLQNVINSCVILSRSPIIQREDLPEDLQETGGVDPSGRSLDDLAQMLIRSGSFSEDQPLEENLLASLARHLVDELGSKAKAARMLGISRPALYRRLKVYDTLHDEG